MTVCADTKEQRVARRRSSGDGDGILESMMSVCLSDALEIDTSRFLHSLMTFGRLKS